MSTKLSKQPNLCFFVIALSIATILWYAAIHASASAVSAAFIPANTATEISCTVGEYTFGSGDSPYPETHAVTIQADCINAGVNTILLETVDATNTGHWLIWDSLALFDGTGTAIWSIGDDEAPPDYANPAFDEFDQIPPFTADFDRRTMSDSEFPFQLNDGELRQIRITFELTAAQANQALTLRLDTLFATHTGAPSFTMRVQTSTPERFCVIGEYTFESGSTAAQEAQSIVIAPDCMQPGLNTILLEAAEPLNTNHWLIWDALSLTDSTGSIVWSLGKDEAPSDYSANAFNEFDRIGPFTTRFDVRTMGEEQFPFHINDSSLRQMEIAFDLTTAQILGNLTLRLDTLYATHDPVTSFTLRVSVKCTTAQCTENAQPTPTATPTPIATTVACSSAEYTFGSGASIHPEKQAIVIAADCLQPGINTVLLDTTDAYNTGHWLIWDSLSLSDALGTTIWRLGEDEAPTDYSKSAFDEFDQTAPFQTTYDVETMQASDFPYGLNDGELRQVQLTFKLTEQETNSHVTLALDSLYATHDTAAAFNLRVHTNCDTKQCSVEPSPTPTPTVETAAKPLVLIYSVLDNNLNEGWTRLVNQIEAGKHEGIDVRLMVDALGTEETGRENAYVYDPLADDDPFCPNLLNYTCGGRYVESQNFWHFGTEDTATPSSLYSFVIKALKEYPNASSVTLVLVGHGAGWSANVLPGQPSFWQDQVDGLGGLLWDDTVGGENQSGHSLSTKSLGLALFWATAQSSHTIDLLYLDGCNLGAIEVAYEVRDSAKFLLASPNVSWLSLNYDTLLSQVGNSPSSSDQCTPQDLGRCWLEAEADFLDGHPGHPYTLALIDLQKLDPLASAMSQLRQGLLNNQESGAVKELGAVLDRYDCNFNGQLDQNDSCIDLLSLATAIQGSSRFSEATRNSVQQLMSALNDAVPGKRVEGGTPWLYPEHLWQWQQFGGLSVYLPIGETDEARRALYYHPEYLDWTAATAWHEFLAELWKPGVQSADTGETPNVPVCQQTTDECSMLARPLPLEEKLLYLPVIQSD